MLFRLFVCSFVRSFVSCVRWLVGSCVGVFVCSCVRVFVGSLVRWFVGSLVRSLARSFVRWFVRCVVGALSVSCRSRRAQISLLPSFVHFRCNPPTSCVSVLLTSLRRVLPFTARPLFLFDIVGVLTSLRLGLEKRSKVVPFVEPSTEITTLLR